METWKIRLKTETKELADKVNKLHAYMATPAFYLLSREDKDLLYAQQEHMMKYLHILGKRCEKHNIDLLEESNEENTLGNGSIAADANPR
jgi:hypothetical protein